MKVIKLHISVFFFVLVNLVYSQPKDLEIQTFKQMSPLERYDFLHHSQLSELDSAVFYRTYRAFFEIASAEKDKLSQWVLRFYYFSQRNRMKSTPNENIQLLTELENTANQEKYLVEQIIAHHYLTFERHYANQASHEEVYVTILKEFEEMETLGFEKFKHYSLAKLLFHDGGFLYQLEDYEQALILLKEAENFIQPNHQGAQTYILVLNHIQSIYQQQKNDTKALKYAHKILSFTQNFQAKNPEDANLYLKWQGLSSVDIASILASQGNMAESEVFANKGYELTRSNETSLSTFLNLEYNALQALIPTKIALGKLVEAEKLLKRMDEVHEVACKDPGNYFNHIKYYECHAQFSEKTGNLAAAMRYLQLAKPLKDSLQRRNDARRLDKLQRNLEIEKYNAKLQNIQDEKEHYKWLKNVAILMLVFVLVAASFYVRHLMAQRKQKEQELQTAKDDLSKLTQGLREKSEQVAKLRIEIETLASKGETSQYLEQLMNSTILTDDDWVQFRNAFEKVHPGFIAEQKTAYPQLTQAEIRYLVLEKLQLTTHEMANMLGVSDGTIRQTRMRLRRKTS